jgi:beta-N-acetylhexosaminidase
VPRRPEYDPLVDDLSVERRAAQLVVPVLDLRPSKGNDPDESFAQAEKWLDDLGVGGFILFGGDEKTKKRLEALKRPGRGPAGIGPLIASDLERGVGQQVKGGTILPPLMALGASRDEKLAAAAGALTGREARAVGIDWVFAPVLDLADLPENPIVQARAFGSAPDLVTRLGIAWAKALEEEDVVACAKHFPGHGGTTQDSHEALPKVTRSRETLEARDLAPFHAAAELPLGSFMTAHVAYPSLAKGGAPATLEPRITEAYLRKAWRYDGVVSTDALIMTGLLEAVGGEEGAAAVLALEAGCDVLLYPKDPKAVVRALAGWARTNGQPARARLQDAVGRVLHMKRRLGLAGPAYHRAPRHAPAALPDPEGQKLGQRIAESSTTRLGARHEPLASGKKALLLTIDDDGVESPGLDLVLELQPKLAELRTTTLGPQATAEERERARGLAAGVDRVVATVLCRARGWKGRAGLEPAHAAFLRSLGSIGVPLTVVGLCSPYALAGACPRGSEVLLVYGDDPASQRAAAAALLGGPAPGALPVETVELFA